MLVNVYVGNTDWAHHNWYASRSRVDPNGRWRFHSWDAEHVLKELDHDVTGRNNTGSPTYLHQKLCANADYEGVRSWSADLLFKYKAHRVGSSSFLPFLCGRRPAVFERRLTRRSGYRPTSRTPL